MGNRAVITLGTDKPSSVGIYLHWNGGRASVEGFLQAARELGVRPNDPSYATARICQIAANYFGGTLSIGIGTLSELDCNNGDNGLYFVDPATLTIARRKYHRGAEEINATKTAEIAAACVSRFPKSND